MTATMHHIPARPASRHLDAARMTLADEGASVDARLNAADMMTIFGDDADALDAKAFRDEIVAQIEAQRQAPLAWVDDDARRPVVAALVVTVAVITIIVCAVIIADKAMGNIAATMLDVEEAR